MDKMQQHKYDYGIIGNCAYLALVDTQANIGWMCWPRFDSSFIFGNMLDEERGGHFSVQPEWDSYESSQGYIYNTNILETTFECEDGVFKVIDFAPRFYQYERFYKPLMLVRKIIPIKGTPRIRVSCQPVGDYSEKHPEKVFGSSHIRYTGLDAPVRLTTNVPLNYVDKEQAFVLNETKHCILTWGVPLEGPLESTVDSFLEKTTNYWRTWVLNTATENFHQRSIIRSALTLKLHQYQDTGAIIAAASTSLPEYPGSGRNWDYRLCHLGDTHYTIKALNDLSHFGVLESYANFIQNIVLNEDRRYHPMYPIAMDHAPVERILPLDGYQGERPVRVGNQAYEHIQNDVYGQVLVTLLPLFTDRRLLSNDSSTLINIVRHCLGMIRETMDEEDHGNWGFRGITQFHTYTFLFHWVGANSALKIARSIGDQALEKEAADLIQIASEKIESCYDENRGVYTQAVGSDNLDASTLQLINMGYLDPKGDRAKKHLAVLESELKAESGLFYRYKHVDDFGKPESTFLICAFWYVEALARMDRLDEAIQNFEQLLEYGNHVGLFSENVHESSGSQYGNFPQTYSHVGMINAAFTISKKLDKPPYL